MNLTHKGIISGRYSSYQSLCGHWQRFDDLAIIDKCVNCIYCLGIMADRKQEETSDMPINKLDEARRLRESADKMLTLAATLEDEAKKESPLEPHRTRGMMFKIAVQFPSPSIKTYTYLVLRVKKFPDGGFKYFTTGNGDTGCFDSWKEFVAWIEGDKVSGHGALISLDSAEPRQAYRFGNKYK